MTQQTKSPAEQMDVREALNKIHGQAHAGAMLGSESAYQACLTIEAIVAGLSQPDQQSLRLAEGCRSASSPCWHQKQSPSTLCEHCQPHLKAVTIVIPSGYRDAAEFLKDCQFEEAALPPSNPPGDVRDIKSLAAEAIRTFCKSLGEGIVAISTDGMERIYYSGLSLEALAAAVAMKLASPKDAEATSVGAQDGGAAT